MTFGWEIQEEPDYPWLINIYRLGIKSIGIIGKSVECTLFDVFTRCCTNCLIKYHCSFHEIAIYDIPASLRMVKRITKVDKITYIGYSGGATVALIYASLLKSHAKNTINLFIAISGGSYMNHVTFPIWFFSPGIYFIKVTINLWLLFSGIYI